MQHALVSYILNIFLVWARFNCDISYSFKNKNKKKHKCIVNLDLVELMAQLVLLKCQKVIFVMIGNFKFNLHCMS